MLLLQVHDSAASRAGWVEALGLLEEQDATEDENVQTAAGTAGAVARDMHAPSAAAAACQIHGPAGHGYRATPGWAAGRATLGAVAATSEAAVQTEDQNHHYHHHQQQWGDGGGGGNSGAAARASCELQLLEAAGQEVLRLQELNQTLLETHARGQ